MRDRSYHVYILTNRRHGTLYAGVTNDLPRRTYERRIGLAGKFTRKYNCHRLVWFETPSDIRAAITREKRIKNWNRAWKIELIEAKNPAWTDLSTTF